MYKMSNQTDILESLFQCLNKRFYNDELSMPVITIQADTKKKAYGWYTCYKAWKQGEEGKPEINISANYLNRSFKETASTMLHEMAHHYNYTHNIKDTTRGGSYHNKKFKETAEAHGLVIEYDRKCGWTITKLNDEAEKYMEQFKDVQLAYRPDVSEKKTTPKKTSYKHTCPQCGAIARTTKIFKLYCGNCSCEDNLVEMEIESNEED